MRPPLKILTGLVAVLAAAWAWHAPLGRGEAFAQRLDREARAAIAPVGLPGVDVRIQRDPIARNAVFSGPANDLQREGLGSEKGLSDYVRAVPGVSAVRWADQADSGGRGAIPLLAETMLLAALAYLIGLGLGWLLWGRPRREGFL